MRWFRWNSFLRFNALFSTQHCAAKRMFCFLGNIFYLHLTPSISGWMLPDRCRRSLELRGVYWCKPRLTTLLSFRSTQKKFWESDYNNELFLFLPRILKPPDVFLCHGTSATASLPSASIYLQCLPQTSLKIMWKGNSVYHSTQRVKCFGLVHL